MLLEWQLSVDGEAQPLQKEMRSVMMSCMSANKRGTALLRCGLPAAGPAGSRVLNIPEVGNKKTFKTLRTSTTTDS